MSFRMRLAGWAMRFISWNPRDTKWKERVNVLADPAPPAAPTRSAPRPGLLLNTEGNVFLETGGPAIGAIRVTPNREIWIWTVLRDASILLEREGAEPLFVNGGESKTVISVDALWKSVPHLTQSKFSGFSNDTPQQEIHFWLEQLKRF